MTNHINASLSPCLHPVPESDYEDLTSLMLQATAISVHSPSPPPTVISVHSPSPPPTVISVRTPVRFLMAAEGQSLPLCFDIPAGHSVKLLQDPVSGFSMNGQLMSEGGNGFQKIIIRVNADKHIEFDTNKITIKDGQYMQSFMWTDSDIDHTTDSMIVIIRDSEADITMTNIRVVILLHRQDGKRFLWPAVRKRPSENEIPGIMGKLLVAYEEVNPTKLRIQGVEVNASSDSAGDYSIKAVPRVKCQLVDLKSALQGELSDFTVPQL